MDTSKLRTGEMIAGIAGVLLFIVMFLGWFGISSGDIAGISGEDLQEMAESLPDPGDAESASFSAWETMSVIDLIIGLTAIVAAGLALATATARSVSLPVAASAITAGLGILSTVLILYRIIDPPYALSNELWVFVGLILAAAIAYGGWRSMQEEGTSFGDQYDRVSGGDDTPTAPPPTAPPPAQ